MYVCMYVGKHAKATYVYVSEYVCREKCMIIYLCTHEYMYVCIYVCRQTGMSLYMYIHIHVDIHT